MSATKIPEKTCVQLWVKAGGRCQYEGCNAALWRDDLTMTQMNRAYIAHIVADQPKGPRGDRAQSVKLRKDIRNLMLLCDTHHRLVDVGDVAGHPVSKLQAMKLEHERRIEHLTSFQENKKSYILLYGANIGDHASQLDYHSSAQAMLPDRYPAESRAIELSWKNSALTDGQDDYWRIERDQLRRQFGQQVKPRLAAGDNPHFSVFGLAPQPLLMELGRLLSDISDVEVFQPHREPRAWKWLKLKRDFKYLVTVPATRHPCVALNLSLSGTITKPRIQAILKEKFSLWTLTISNPNNDFLQSREQLQLFRQCFRGLLNQIKARHGEKALIHLFPAVPAAIAVEIGRVWMPKADLPIRIYDQNRKRDGFQHVFDVDQN